jgi:hypothetical protein
MVGKSFEGRPCYYSVLPIFVGLKMDWAAGCDKKGPITAIGGGESNWSDYRGVREVKLFGSQPVMRGGFGAQTTLGCQSGLTVVYFSLENGDL